VANTVKRIRLVGSLLSTLVAEVDQVSCLLHAMLSDEPSGFRNFFWSRF